MRASLLVSSFSFLLVASGCLADVEEERSVDEQDVGQSVDELKASKLSVGEHSLTAMTFKPDVDVDNGCGSPSVSCTHDQSTPYCELNGHRKPASKDPKSGKWTCTNGYSLVKPATKDLCEVANDTCLLSPPACGPGCVEVDEITTYDFTTGPPAACKVTRTRVCAPVEDDGDGFGIERK